MVSCYGNMECQFFDPITETEEDIVEEAGLCKKWKEDQPGEWVEFITKKGTWSSYPHPTNHGYENCPGYPKED